jgi:DNA-binding transcriptional ArsR family regulator
MNSANGQGRRIDRDRLGRDPFHPMREAIIWEMDSAAGPMSPSELAEIFKEEIGNVSYHVKALATAGVVTLDHTKPARGAVQHFYVLADGVVVSLTEEAAALDSILQIVANQLGRAKPSRGARASLDKIAAVLDKTGRSL